MSEHEPPARLVRAPPQTRDTLALALPLCDARTTITFDRHSPSDPALAPQQDLYFGTGH